ncbi:MAG: hypothetical protein UH853_01430 [Muribaculaceae bacterium]|jgi:Tol biopolymer transport system component|nr:hypothetical protein [Muribaculaceae bacterium]
MKKLFLCIALGAALTSYAQQFEVVELQQVKTGATQAFHPRFMPDGKSLLVTSEGYDGLGIVDIEKGTYTQLTDMPGAGYYPVISEDGKTILTRSMDREQFTQNIYKLDVKSKALTIVAENIEHTNQMSFSNGLATVAISGKAVASTISSTLTPVRKMNNILVTEEDLKIVVYKNGVRTVLDPLAGKYGNWDPQYCWTSLSPDNTKILFHCANNSFTCDLDGKNVVDLGELRSPQWRGDSHVVGMNDCHDGYYYTKSDIVIVRTDGTQFQQLTYPSNEIKMFPSVSADGNKIAFHTENEGKIYIMTIKEK